MTVECKTGCGKQVEYEKIVFDDGFIFHLPRNPDLSFHFCEIFHDENSLFSNPGGGYSYDGNPLRENSYGYEIIDYDQFLFDFDYFIMERNKSLSKDDILQYKHQLQSRIIHLPILGLYTDVLGGLYTGCLDEKVSKKFINCIFFNKKIHPENDKLCYFNSTLGSDPLESLKKIYYILEGKSKNYKKCEQLINQINEQQEIFNSKFENKNNNKTNPYEIKINEVKKQIRIFEKKLKENPNDVKISEVLTFYDSLLTGNLEYDHKIDGVVSPGLVETSNRRKQEIHSKTSKHVQKLVKKLNISQNEFETNWKYSQNWDYMQDGEKLELLEISERKDTKKLLKMNFTDIRIYDIQLFNEFLKSGVCGNNLSLDELKIVEKFHKSLESDNSYDIESVRLLAIQKIYQHIKNNNSANKKIIHRTEITLDRSSYPAKYNFNKFYEQILEKHFFTFISTSENYCREFVLDYLFEGNKNFLERYFQNINSDINLRKNSSRMNLYNPESDSPLEDITLGELIKIMKDPYVKNIANEKNIANYQNFINLLYQLLSYRNPSYHNKGLVKGDLPFDQKIILYSICAQVNEFCKKLLEK